jgi:hypothetical protein
MRLYTHVRLNCKFTRRRNETGYIRTFTKIDVEDEKHKKRNSLKNTLKAYRSTKIKLDEDMEKFKIVMTGA